MSAERIKRESGYSLVDVMVSILIMTLAILPMMTMFDMGLHSATTGSNYDRARTFASSQLEQAHALAYADVRDNFPAGAPPPNSSTDPSPVPASLGLPPGSTYTVTKQYMAKASQNPPLPSEPFNTSPTDQGLMRVSVTVQWANNEYTTIGFVAQ